MRGMHRLLALLAVGAIIVSGCSAAATPDPTAIRGKFDIGGRSLYLECSGSGAVTVILDAGLGNTHATWQSVAPEVSKLTRTCSYDRANIGASDAAAKPRTSRDVVSDLRALLKAAVIPPPYILSGHSFAGGTMRLFAAMYPAEVKGLVLVDPTPPSFLDGECAIVDAALCDILRRGFAPDHNPEGLDFLKSGPEVVGSGPLPTVPFIVLAATGHHQPAITDPSVEKQIEVLWQAEEAKLAARVPGGTMQVVDSGHDIQLLHPNAVVDALKSVIAAAGPAAS